MIAALEEKAANASAESAPCCGRKAGARRSAASADTLLRRAVLARLIADPSVSASHISVTAVAGVVTLFGYVTSYGQKGAASAVAARVKGVELLVDQILVAVPCPTVRDVRPAPLETGPAGARPRAGPAFVNLTPEAIAIRTIA